MSDASDCKQIANKSIEDAVNKLSADIINNCFNAAHNGEFQYIYKIDGNINNALIMQNLFSKLINDHGFKVEYNDSNNSSLRIYWID